MAKTFMKSRWWHLTAAIASFATVGCAVDMAMAHHVFMVCLSVRQLDVIWMYILREAF